MKNTNCLISTLCYVMILLSALMLFVGNYIGAYTIWNNISTIVSTYLLCDVIRLENANE
jgi:hypothetical protein